MMFPIFFSVADKDVNFAEEVWARFPADWCYLFSKNGAEGADMWQEIAQQEIPNCKLYIAFWSKNFLQARGCIRELKQAAELVAEGQIRALVIRLDQTPIMWSPEAGNDTKSTFDALKSLLPIRTSREEISVSDAINLISKSADPILDDLHPQLSRPAILEKLKQSSKKGRFHYYPVLWLSGFSGVGRLSIIKELNRSFAPNGRPIVIDINEAALPKQILLRIESEALGADYDRLSAIQEDSLLDSPNEVANAIKSVGDTGNYIVLRHQKIIEGNADIPEWIDDCIRVLETRNRPYLFITSQMPVSVERRVRCNENMVDDRIPTLLDDDINEYADQLIAFYDLNPERWPEEHVRVLTASSGGNLGFLVTLIKSVARIEDFDKIDQFVRQSSERQAESIAFYVGWAFNQLEDDSLEQKALLFLNDVSPCDANDLARAIGSDRPVLVVLGKLLELGLVERDIAGLYRLTPLLSGRLSRHIVRQDLVDWRRSVIKHFASAPIEVETEDHEFIRIEARIQAALWGDEPEIPASIQKFVSASHWFQAGVRLYHARHRQPAYKLLRMAFERRQEFRDVSRIELTRYFGLSAVMNNKPSDVELCVKLLTSDHRSKSMGAFLQAFNLERQRRFYDAVKEYKVALSLDVGKNSRLERIYRPLVRCILRTSRPNYREAEQYAVQWSRIRDTVFSKKALAEVYLHWMNRLGPKSLGFEDILGRYDEALEELRVHPSVGSAYFELRSEEADLRGNLAESVSWLGNAIDVDPRFELRVKRWEYMSKAADAELWTGVIEELESARRNPVFKSNWEIFLPSILEAYVRALKASNKYVPTRVNSFAPSLGSKEVAHTIAKVSRELV